MNKQLCGFFFGLYLVLLLFPISAGSEDKVSLRSKIGMLLPLSGPYAALGEDCKQGLEIAKSEFDPNLKLDFIFADTKAEAAQAVVEFKKMIDYDRIIGAFAFRGPVGMAVNPISQGAKIAVLGGVGNKNFATSNDYAFQLWASSDFEGAYMAEKILASSSGKIAILTVQDDYAVALSEGFRQRAKLGGTAIVYDQEILPTDNDFRSQIINIKRLNPEVIFLNLALGQLAPALIQFRQLGGSQVIASNFWVGKKEVITAAGKAAEGVIFAEMSADLVKLKSDLKTRFNSTPSGATLSSYVATHMIAQALEATKEVSTAVFYQSLRAVSEIRTPNGNFPVKDRFVQFPMVMRTITNGEVQ